MKKIFALILCILMIGSLCACGADPLYNGGVATADETAVAETEAKKADITKYEKTFDGMQEYLIDSELLPSDEKVKSETLGSLIGAKEKGSRYMLSSSAFIEFYEYDLENLNDVANNIFSQIEKDGTFVVAEGLETLTGVKSSSGKFLAVYNKNLSYDYDKIISEFKQF